MLTAAMLVVAVLAGLGLATVWGLFGRIRRNRAGGRRRLRTTRFREAQAAVEDLLQIFDERLRISRGFSRCGSS